MEILNTILHECTHAIQYQERNNKDSSTLEKRIINNELEKFHSSNVSYHLLYNYIIFERTARINAAAGCKNISNILKSDNELLDNIQKISLYDEYLKGYIKCLGNTNNLSMLYLDKILKLETNDINNLSELEKIRLSFSIKNETYENLKENNKRLIKKINRNI